MIIIHFVVEGIPVAKGRARITTRGGFAHSYTPPKTAAYAKIVTAQAVIAMADKQLLEGPLHYKVVCYMPIPKSERKAVRQNMKDGLIHHTKKPDVDNLAKALTDPLTGIVFGDDNQIVKLTCSKQYSDYPRAEITIWEV